MEELWKDIKGFEGLYQVSNLGRVRTLNYRMQKGNIQIMKQHINKGPYYVVELSNKNQGHSVRTIFYVHRLVASAFPEICGDYFEGAECNHKNENGLDNRVENLEWITTKENNNYGTRLKRALATKKRNGKRDVPIIQYNLDGSFVREWKSASIAAEELGFSQGHISSCCTGKRNICSGYRWKHLKDVHPFLLRLQKDVYILTPLLSSCDRFPALRSPQTLLSSLPVQ